jgi:hypothetical protein
VPCPAVCMRAGGDRLAVGPGHVGVNQGGRHGRGRKDAASRQHAEKRRHSGRCALGLGRPVDKLDGSPVREVAPASQRARRDAPATSGRRREEDIGSYAAARGGCADCRLCRVVSVTSDIPRSLNHISCLLVPSPRLGGRCGAVGRHTGVQVSQSEAEPRRRRGHGHVAGPHRPPASQYRTVCVHAIRVPRRLVGR